MGIENREYLRSEFEQEAPRRSSAPSSMVVKVMIVTALVFLFQLFTTGADKGSAVTQSLQLTSGDLYFRGQIWRLLTYALCHSTSSPFHILFNMATLYWVGSVAIRLTGDREFLWFYVVSAVFSGICSVVFYSLIGMSPSIIGASGAVNAVFCLVAMHYPRLQVLFLGVFPVEMRWLLAGFCAADLLPILGGRSDVSQVAHSAHLGGLLFGFLYFRWQMRLTRWWDDFAGRISRRRRARNLKIFAPSTAPESDLDQQVDRILEKISREGEASLTSRERNILTQASRKLRKERG